MLCIHTHTPSHTPTPTYIRACLYLLFSWASTCFFRLVSPLPVSALMALLSPFLLFRQVFFIVLSYFIVSFLVLLFLILTGSLLSLVPSPPSFPTFLVLPFPIVMILFLSISDWLSLLLHLPFLLLHFTMWASSSSFLPRLSSYSSSCFYFYSPLPRSLPPISPRFPIYPLRRPFAPPRHQRTSMRHASPPLSLPSHFHSLVLFGPS